VAYGVDAQKAGIDPEALLAGFEQRVDMMFRAELVLWYDEPAEQWLEALVLGNGRVGAMVFGGLEEETIQLSEETMWSGGPYNPNDHSAKQFLPEIRRLAWEDKRNEAMKLVGKSFIAIPYKMMAYQTIGELNLSIPGHGNATSYPIRP
jgi:alpha-L-fucosidase 2